jgi:hypothetical protein
MNTYLGRADSCLTAITEHKDPEIKIEIRRIGAKTLINALLWAAQISADKQVKQMSCVPGDKARRELATIPPICQSVHHRPGCDCDRGADNGRHAVFPVAE